MTVFILISSELLILLQPNLVLWHINHERLHCCGQGHSGDASFIECLAGWYLLSIFSLLSCNIPSFYSILYMHLQLWNVALTTVILTVFFEWNLVWWCIMVIQSIMHKDCFAIEGPGHIDGEPHDCRSLQLLKKQTKNNWQKDEINKSIEMFTLVFFK